MKRLHIFIASIIITLPAALAQAHVIFDSPSPNQLLQDQRECENLARYQVSGGAQPLQSAVYTNAGLFSGPARGAATGALFGYVEGHTGRGAALGTLTGSMNAGMRSNQQQLQQFAQQEEVARAQQDVFNETFNNCMRSRGY